MLRKKVINNSITGAQIIIEALKLQGVNKNVYGFSGGAVYSSIFLYLSYNRNISKSSSIL